MCAHMVCVGGSIPLLELASEASAEALSGSTLSFEATISAIASSEALDSSIGPVSSPETVDDLEASPGFLPPASADFPLSMKLHSEEATRDLCDSSEEALDSPEDTCDS